MKVLALVLSLATAFTFISCDSVTDSKPLQITRPTLLEPVDYDTTVSLTPLFKWSGEADVIEIGSDISFGHTIFHGDVTGNQFQMPGGYLQPVTYYYWRAGKSTAGTLYWSQNVFTFKTRN